MSKMEDLANLVNDVTEDVAHTFDVIDESKGVAVRFKRVAFVSIGDLSAEQKRQLGVLNKGVVMAQEQVDAANGALILARQTLKEALENRTKMAKEMGVNPRLLG